MHVLKYQHLGLTSETPRPLPPDVEIHDPECDSSISPQTEQPQQLDVPAQAVCEAQSTPT